MLINSFTKNNNILNNYIDKMKSEVNLMLSNYKIIDGVSLQGNLNKISVTNLLLVPGAIRLEANITGKIALKVDDLKF